VKRIGIWIVALLIGSAPGFADDAANPHLMLGADGQADTGKCALCHNDDLTLSRSKVETCTLCHSPTVHAGAQEHMRMDAARVARLVPPPQEGVPDFPLTEDGKIYCGTCHVFHDPRVSDEKILDRKWAPTDKLGQAVRESLAARLEASASAEGEKGAAKFSNGTMRLRLPVADGSLCRHCHRYGK